MALRQSEPAEPPDSTRRVRQQCACAYTLLWRSRHLFPRTRRKQCPQMLAVGLTRVSRGEDASQTTVLRDERAADVMRGHVFENGIEPGTAVDGIWLRHVDIADEELIQRRQADLGIKRPSHIAVRE